MTSTITFSPQQSDFFDALDHTEENIVLEAVAGAGKTFTLIEGLNHMPGRAFLGAYNSKMGAELKARVAGRDGVYASTFHSAGFKQLKYSFKDRALRVFDRKVAEIVDEMIVGRDDLSDMSSSVPAIVSMAKQRGFGIFKPLCDYTAEEWTDMISYFGLDENLPDNARMDQLIAMSKLALKRSIMTLDVIDYDDMIYVPLLKNLRMFAHDWVLIDEAQDTNPIRRLMAKKLLKPGGRLIAVGDPRQAIFGFTGADNDSLSIIEQEFKCRRMPLTVTYRCPKAVVAHARQWVDHIEAHESAPEGEVLSVKYDDMTAQPGDAILCRKNKWLATTFFKLVRQGVSAKIEGKEIGQGLVSLATKWKRVKNLDALKAHLLAHMDKEVEKAMKAKQERKAEYVTDQVETLFVLIERAKETGVTDVEGLKVLIEGMFSDDVTKLGDMVILCSVHKSKGLEWDRVFLLGRDEFMPSPFARQEWQIEQEINLIYVAVTRAKKTLVEVTNVDTEKRRGGAFGGVNGY